MIIRIQTKSIFFPRVQDVTPTMRPAALVAATAFAPAAVMLFTMALLTAVSHLMKQSRMAESRYLLTIPTEMPAFWLRWQGGPLRQYALLAALFALCAYLFSWLAEPNGPIARGETESQDILPGMHLGFSRETAPWETFGT